MTLLLIGITLLVIATLIVGWRLSRRPKTLPRPRWLAFGLSANLGLFALGLAGALLLASQEVLAQQAAVGAREMSMATALAILGVGLPTAIAALAAAIALGSIGAASLAVIAEKPELFGRTLVYMGLAEGIAIYGLVMSILLLTKL